MRGTAAIVMGAIGQRRSISDELTRPGAATEEAEAHDRLQHRYALAEKVEVEDVHIGEVRDAQRERDDYRPHESRIQKERYKHASARADGEIRRV